MDPTMEQFRSWPLMPLDAEAQVLMATGRAVSQTEGTCERMGEYKACFFNSWLNQTPRLRYTEGFAQGAIGLWMHHAWLTDPDGRIVETTWDSVTPRVGVILGPADLDEMVIDTDEMGYEPIGLEYPPVGTGQVLLAWLTVRASIEMASRTGVYPTMLANQEMLNSPTGIRSAFQWAEPAGSV